MASSSHRPGAGAGAWVGLAVAAPVTAFLFAAHRALEAPFPPFALFELLTRLAPGALVTRGIDVMVSLIRRVGLEDTAQAAKLTEQVLAGAVFLFLAAVLGAAAFVAARRTPSSRSSIVVGLVGGGVLAAMWVGALIAQGEGAGGIALALVGAALWGGGLAWAHRALSRSERTAATAPAGAPMDRRTVVVRIGTATAVLTFAGVALSRALTRSKGPGVGGAGVPWSATNPLPNADAPVLPVPGTRPELTPVDKHYRIDINLVPPRIRESDWRLRFGGLVEQERAFTLDELRALPALHQLITLACISNPVAGDLIGTTRWSGVSLSRVLDEVGVRPEATHLKLTSADSFDEIVSIAEARSDPRVMLTYAWDGLPLTEEHGFPLRIYLPNRYGMKQPKWIERIEAISGWEPGYWVRRGWDREARMKATSVIDVVGPEPIRNARGELVLPIGGIAHAGARSISRVEVRVDGGEWRPAELREPLSPLTWVLWRYEWPFQAGEHTFEVRCIDGEGAAQLTERAPPHPSGASGLHSVTRTV